MTTPYEIASCSYDPYTKVTHSSHSIVTHHTRSTVTHHTRSIVTNLLKIQAPSAEALGAIISAMDIPGDFLVVLMIQDP